jgi:hypothetical protein
VSFKHKLSLACPSLQCGTSNFVAFTLPLTFSDLKLVLKSGAATSVSALPMSE